MHHLGRWIPSCCLSLGYDTASKAKDYMFLAGRSTRATSGMRLKRREATAFGFLIDPLGDSHNIGGRVRLQRLTLLESDAVLGRANATFHGTAQRDESPRDVMNEQD